jgi:nucleotide-binding universal stress UspA family protein
MYQTILMPTDGSQCSESAIAHALELAQKLGSKVTFLYVLEDPTRNLWLTPEMPYVPELLQDLEGAAKSALERAMALAQQAGVVAQTRQVSAKPVDGILEEAKNADLVVMGTHGRSGIDKMLLGSVTEGVLHRCRTPVLVVRTK